MQGCNYIYKCFNSGVWSATGSVYPKSIPGFNIVKGNFLRSFLFLFSSMVLIFEWYLTLSPDAKKSQTPQSSCGNLSLQEITSNILEAAHKEFPRFFRCYIPSIAIGAFHHSIPPISGLHSVTSLLHFASQSTSEILFFFPLLTKGCGSFIPFIHYIPEHSFHSYFFQ